MFDIYIFQLQVHPLQVMEYPLLAVKALWSHPEVCHLSISNCHHFAKKLFKMYISHVVTV